MGGSIRSGGGEIVVVGSQILNTQFSLDQRPVTRGSAGENYIYDLLDLCAEDQQPLDPV
jgi:hypothetical protein